MDQPNLEVPLQEANLEPASEAQKAEGDAIAAEMEGKLAPEPKAASTADASAGSNPGAKPDEKADAHDEFAAPRPSIAGRARALAKDLFESLFSSDRLTRKTAFLFFAGIIGAIFVSVAAVKRVSHLRAVHAIEQKKREAEELRLRERENSRLSDLKTSEFVVSLGRYMIALKTDGAKTAGGAPTAEFELSVRCSDKEVREYIEARSVQLRSELTSALVGLTREDFLAVDGKRRTHKKILLVLNQWLVREYSGARIEDVWFSDLVVE